MNEARFEYDQAGVDTSLADQGLEHLARSLRPALAHRDGYAWGKPAMGLGYYANVLQIPGNSGLAISTDGVGTKIILAELTGRYDTIAIDMIAMNVNDLLCVGAEPIALVDYIAVGEIRPDVFDQLGRGLLEGARQSRITIPGGEIAQVRELLRGHGDSSGLDLVGTAVGLVDWDRINFGQDVRPGDVVVGLASSGVHSNGFTLVRRVLLDQPGLKLDHHVPELGHTLADELLRPTRIYVEPVMQMMQAGLRLAALLHITGGGFTNLNRVRAKVGFELDAIPAPPPVFRLIEERGRLSAAEMYSVFNMGIGFCVVTDEASTERVIEIARSCGVEAWRIGHASADHPNEVKLPQLGLTGSRDRLHPE